MKLNMKHIFHLDKFFNAAGKENGAANLNLPEGGSISLDPYFPAAKESSGEPQLADYVQETSEPCSISWFREADSESGWFILCRQ